MQNENKQKDRLVELISSKICATTYELEGIAEHLLANGVIVLPYALGEKVYFLGQPCGGCECFNEPMTEEFIEKCRRCDKWEIGECSFDYELIPEWGKYVFPTKEQAEEALNKLKGDAE